MGYSMNSKKRTTECQFFSPLGWWSRMSDIKKKKNKPFLHHANSKSCTEEKSNRVKTIIIKEVNTNQRPLVGIPSWKNAVKRFCFLDTEFNWRTPTYWRFIATFQQFTGGMVCYLKSLICSATSGLDGAVGGGSLLPTCFVWGMWVLFLCVSSVRGSVMMDSDHLRVWGWGRVRCMRIHQPNPTAGGWLKWRRLRLTALEISVLDHLNLTKKKERKTAF